jgi:hypothetical protein
LVFRKIGDVTARRDERGIEEEVVSKYVKFLTLNFDVRVKVGKLHG